MKKNLRLALIATICCSGAVAFAPTPRPTQPVSSTALSFGIPKFFLPDEGKDESGATSENKKEEKKIGAKGLLQLITAGAGSPWLGDFEGVDEETGKFMFSLEANNLVDENGNSKQTKMPYFESGWVDENDTGFKWPWEKKET